MQKELASCQICEKVVAANGGNTSNLISHLRVHHPAKHKEFRRAHAAAVTSITKKGEKSKTLHCQPLILDSLKAAQNYE